MAQNNKIVFTRSSVGQWFGLGSAGSSSVSFAWGHHVTTWPVCGPSRAEWSKACLFPCVEVDPGCQPGLSPHVVPPYGCWLHRVVQRQHGGRTEVTRPQEAFVGNSLNVTSQFIHQRKSQALPSFGGWGKKMYPLMRRATIHIVKVTEEFMAIFIIYRNPQISKVYFY